MNNLSNTILDYFLSNFDNLPLDKQLHFASRLWFWRRDETSRKLLDDLRSKILPTEDVIDTLRQINDGSLLPLRQGSANVLHLRQPYFDRYPDLRRTATTLYWALMLDSCYGLDARSRLDELLDLEALQKLYERLLNDPEAIAVLSTHAVNFMYLYQRYVLRTENVPIPADFTALASKQEYYPAESALHTQLRIYLLTHTIIGETLFYQRPLPTDKLSPYKPVVVELESIIRDQMQAVNLDNKLEFLVCCRLTNYRTQLEAAILQEASISLSSDGDFLVDVHNTNPQSAYTTFDKSEHRSLLYLLTTIQRVAR